MSDIIGMSAVSEGMDSDQLAQMLNESASSIQRYIMANKGHVLHFSGDAVLAYWEPLHTAPSHAELAFNCAKQILSEISSRSLKSENSLGIRIALGTGQMTGDLIGGRFQIIGLAYTTAERLIGFKSPPISSMLCTAETLAHIPGAIIPPTPRSKFTRTTGEEVEVFEFSAS